MSGEQTEQCIQCGGDAGLRAAGRNGVFRPICVDCMMEAYDDSSRLDRIKNRVKQVLC